MKALQNPEACGRGQGRRCCGYLIYGFFCGRTITPTIYEMLRAQLLRSEMNANYDPGDTPYPECQRLRKPLAIVGSPG
jgi:hypothetical protein